MRFNLELPINALSFGQIGWGVLYEIYKRGLNPNVFPLGQIDLNPFIKDNNFAYWLDTNCKKAINDFQSLPTIKLWHINGSERKLGSWKHVLWTAHECSELTPQEVEICRGYNTVLVTSNYSKEIFEKHGLTNVKWCPNFFDETHLKASDAPRPADKPITFSLIGKMEHRKHTRNILTAWANLYYNKKDFRLNCLIFNPFIPPEQQQQEIHSWFGGRVPWNINFMGFQPTNEDVSKVMSDTDISLSGLSGAEGFNLPFFNDLCLGKICVGLNAHAHKDFANEDNCILVEPSGTQNIADGRFFQPDGPFNQGRMFNFSMEDSHAAMQKAVDKLKICDKFELRADLIEKFSVKNTVDTILESLQ